MKKTLLIVTIIIGALALVGCTKDNRGKTEDTLIKVIATAVPHAEILEEADRLLKNTDFKIEIIETDDYFLPNPSISNKEADANFFQHIPFLNTYNASAKESDRLVNAAGIHIEPLAGYSKKYNTLAEVQEGATVLISTSTSDHARTIAILVQNNLITLKNASTDPYNATLDDIDTQNSKVKIKDEVDANLLPAAFINNEADIVFINGNFALQNNLSSDDILISESTENNPYVNVVACLPAKQNSQDVQKLIEVLTSNEMKEFITNKYKGSVIPV